MDIVKNALDVMDIAKKFLDGIGSSNSVEADRDGVTFKVDYNIAKIHNYRNTAIHVNVTANGKQKLNTYVPPGQESDMESDAEVCTMGKVYIATIVGDNGKRLVRWRLRGSMESITPPRGHLVIDEV